METPCHSHIRTFLTRWSNRRAFLCLRKKWKATEEAVTHSRGRRPFTARHGFFPGLAALQTQKLHPHHQLWNLQQVYSQWTSPVTSLNHFFWPLQDHPVSSATVQSPLYNKALLFVLNLAISASPPIPCYENGDSSALPCSPSLNHQWFYRALSPSLPVKSLQAEESSMTQTLLLPNLSILPPTCHCCLGQFCPELSLLSAWSCAGHRGGCTRPQLCPWAACNSFLIIVFVLRGFFSEHYPRCLQHLFPSDST